MARVTIEAVVAGTRPMDAYGGIRLDGAVVERVASAIRDGSMPLRLDHDIRREWEAEVIDVEVRDAADGYKDLVVRFEVDENEWAKREAELASMGAPGGFSISFSEPLVELPALADAPDTRLTVAADASHWSDDELLAAAEELRAAGTVEVGRRYELSFIATAVVVLEFLLTPVPGGVTSIAVYEGLRHFLRRAGSTSVVQPTVFHFRVQRPDGTLAEAHLETADEAVLHHAIDALEQIATDGEGFEWADEPSRWKRVR